MNPHKNTLSQALHDAVAESLENMFFSEVQDVEFHWGSVEVVKPINGKVTIAFPRELALEIVNEVFGVERQQITIDVINDIIAEVANTVAGRLISTLVAPSETFELLVPETGEGLLEAGQAISFINHYEMNGKVYLVMLEGESLLQFKDSMADSPLATESSDENDAWG